MVQQPHKTPILTIITVVYNDYARLLETAKSLPSSDLNIEWLVIDGKSSDNTLSATNSIPYRRVISEEDNGLYDAMNKGIGLASGEFVMFLNAGDRLAEGFPEILESLYVAEVDAIFCSFYMNFRSGRSLKRSPRTAEYIAHSLPTSHQAIIYRRILLKKFRYSTMYPVSADYQITAEYILKYKNSCINKHELVSVSKNDGGFSQSNFFQSVVDCWRVQKYILELRLLSRLISAGRRIFNQFIVIIL